MTVGIYFFFFLYDRALCFVTFTIWKCILPKNCFAWKCNSLYVDGVNSVHWWRMVQVDELTAFELLLIVYHLYWFCILFSDINCCKMQLNSNDTEKNNNKSTVVIFLSSIHHSTSKLFLWNVYESLVAWQKDWNVTTQNVHKTMAHQKCDEKKCVWKYGNKPINMESSAIRESRAFAILNFRSISVLQSTHDFKRVNYFSSAITQRIG